MKQQEQAQLGGVLAKLERFKPLYFVAPDGSHRCPACGRVIGEGGWSHGVGTKWGDACIGTGAGE